MPAITKRTVDAATPSAKDAFLWDSELRGFGLKVTPAGGRIYVVQYRAGHGRGSPTKRITIGKHGSLWTPTTARKEALRLLGMVAGGADPAGERSGTNSKRLATPSAPKPTTG
jgi:hypothetical protein